MEELGCLVKQSQLNSMRTKYFQSDKKSILIMRFDFPTESMWYSIKTIFANKSSVTFKSKYDNKLNKRH